MTSILEFTGHNFPEVWKFSDGYIRAVYQDDYCPVCYLDNIQYTVVIRPGDVLKRFGTQILIEHKDQ